MCRHLGAAGLLFLRGEEVALETPAAVDVVVYGMLSTGGGAEDADQRFGFVSMAELLLGAVVNGLKFGGGVFVQGRDACDCDGLVEVDGSLHLTILLLETALEGRSGDISGQLLLYFLLWLILFKFVDCWPLSVGGDLW